VLRDVPGQPGDARDLRRRDTEKQDYRFESIVLAIVSSDAFRRRETRD
jgi:hypothetical protein